jgi:DNA-directed RNA polymerase subunit K/omega
MIMHRKSNIPVVVTPHNLNVFNEKTGSLYKSVVILSKRARQIAVKEREELLSKLDEFAPKTDNLEEFFDNREQMEISSHYEKLPKPTLVSISEFLNDEIYYRDPSVEENTQDNIQENPGK